MTISRFALAAALCLASSPAPSNGNPETADNANVRDVTSVGNLRIS